MLRRQVGVVRWEEPVAVARFQIVSVVRQSNGYAWRFLSANNRSMATSASTYPDAGACLVAVRKLQSDLSLAVGVTSQNGNGLWLWRIRVAESDLAISTRRYQRRVRARLACQSFLDLAAAVAPSAGVQVVHFS
jgi:uncharacterized protein YegP (UPF0339 family)